MSILERVLLALSRDPEADPGVANPPGRPDEPLEILRRVFPDLEDRVAGKRVADFGCGEGRQAVALVRSFGCSVTGIDTNRTTLARAVSNREAAGIPEGDLAFVDRVAPAMLGSFDVVISQNSFEHFERPEEVLEVMGRLLNDSGVILLTFGPPWLAPFGSHMDFFCGIPWLNVLFPERVVMKVRSRFRDDGATRYEEVESGLNRMTVARFERIVAESGLDVECRQYECSLGITPLGSIPRVREFFINQVTATLANPRSGRDSVSPARTPPKRP